MECISLTNVFKMGKEEIDSFRHKFQLLALFMPVTFGKAACDKSVLIGSVVEE